MLSTIKRYAKLALGGVTAVAVAAAAWFRHRAQHQEQRAEQAEQRAEQAEQRETIREGANDEREDNRRADDSAVRDELRDEWTTDSD